MLRNTEMQTSILLPTQRTTSTERWRQRPASDVKDRPTYRLPWGGLFACFYIAVGHVIVSTLVYPHPVAREPMRSKVMALTQHRRPCVLVAGDCRAVFQIRPDILADQIGLPDSAVINIATPGQTPAAILAAYREFAARFQPNPVVVVSISVSLVNDTVAAISRTNELLWSLNPLDRLSLVSPREALTATFLPEWTLFKRIQSRIRPNADGWHPVGSAPFLDNGFQIREDPPRGFGPEALEEGINNFKRHWVARPRLDGIAFKQMQNDLRTLKKSGVQLVILDTPLHPALTKALRGTPDGQTYQVFRRRLAHAFRQMKIPILAYTYDIFDRREPDLLFHDVTQLNPTGAALLSVRVGQDLRALFDEGVLEGRKAGRAWPTPLLHELTSSGRTLDGSFSAESTLEIVHE